jgi:hypothetical protein
MDEVKQMYLANDFEEMIDLGVNTVQIPVPLGLFVEGGERLETLTHLMNHVDKVGLKAIRTSLPASTFQKISLLCFYHIFCNNGSPMIFSLLCFRVRDIFSSLVDVVSSVVTHVFYLLSFHRSVPLQFCHLQICVEPIKN